MVNFKVDKEKCINCKLCINDCPMKVISLVNDIPFIEEEKNEKCIKCQHCFAICPTGAIQIDEFNPENSVSLKDCYPTYEKLENLVKGRRSIRKFKQENVDKATLKKLLEDSLHAPTGVNAMKVQYTVVDNIDSMNKFKNEIYNRIKRLADAEKLPEGKEFFAGIAEAWCENGVDIVFRGAPHMVIASCDPDCHTPDIDSVVALSYLDLLAPAMGLGTLWVGMAKWAIYDILPEMSKELGVPENHVFGYVMLLGKPVVKYARTVQRETKINFIH